MASGSETERNKRNEILDAAVDVLLSEGFEAASMELVAKRASVSRRTVFNQFATKDALFSAALERFWSRMPMVRIAGEQESLDDPAIGLTRIGQTIAEFWGPPASIALARMIVREGSRFPSLARDYLALGKVPALGIVVEYLGSMASAGRLTLADPDLAARQFIGMINEPVVWFRVLGLEDAPSAEREAQVVGEAVKTFLARYGARPGA